MRSQEGPSTGNIPPGGSRPPQDGPGPPSAPQEEEHGEYSDEEFDWEAASAEFAVSESTAAALGAAEVDDGACVLCAAHVFSPICSAGGELDTEALDLLLKHKGRIAASSRVFDIVINQVRS